jgi:outer membrane protein W
MRKSMVVAVSLLFVVASAFAQQRSPSNTVSVFVSDLAISHTDASGTDLDASYGVAFDHMFNQHLSAELSVTSQSIQRVVTTFSDPGPATYRSYTDTLYPIDASVSYHFITEGRWKPYVGGGLRYLDNTISFNGPLGRYRLGSRTIDPEVSGGVTFQFRPNLGLRFDAKQIIGSSHSDIGDNALSGSVGLSFRF